MFENFNRVDKWYERMVEKYSVTDEEELEYLRILRDELRKKGRGEGLAIMIMLVAGIVLLPFIIGLPIVLYALYKMFSEDRKIFEEQENRFLMWRMGKKR